MSQTVNLELEAEKLNDMKQRLDDEKQTITNARRDITAITMLLDKMKQLPIISKAIYEQELMASTSDGVPDVQLAKFIKEIQNYEVAMDGLEIEVNIYDQQLEEKRERRVFKESLMNLYNNVHGEVETLKKQSETEEMELKKKEEDLMVLAKSIKLSTLNVDFIKNRLDARSKLFENYIESIKTADDDMNKLTTELGKLIEDIKKLSLDIINFNTNPERVQEILKKIKEKEELVDVAAEILKKCDQENTNLPQLLDEIHVNKVTNMLESLIKHFQKFINDMVVCKEEIKNTRSGITDIEKLIKTKNEHLEIMLGEIMADMKSKPTTYPTNGSNKDLLNYFTNMFNLKKECHILKTLEKKIKDKGTEVIQMCGTIISCQEKQNEKIIQEVFEKANVVNNLHIRYNALDQEVNVNTDAMILQMKLVNLMEENEHLMVMNAYFKSEGVHLTRDVKIAEEKNAILENENLQLLQSNTELMHSNTELSHKVKKLEKFVELVQKNLTEMQLEDDDDIYDLHDSDDLFNGF